jgi:phage-related minor tail protein
MDAGTLTLLLKANAKGLTKTLSEADATTAAVSKKLGASAVNAKAVIGTAMLGISAAILGGVAALVKLGEKFQEAVFTIRKATGATGTALEELSQSAKRVYVDVDSSLSEVATTIGDLNTRTGMIGQGLEQLATQELKLAKLTGEDLKEQIRQTTRMFGDWSIATDQQSESLDWIWKVSQQTGVGINQLASTVVQFGAPLRQLGFDFETSTAMLGKWEKEGVNIETVLAGMKRGLANFAKDGKDAKEALAAVTDQIKNAGSLADANALAIEVFGQRAGPDMAAAIREGRFDLDTLISTLESSPETIDAAEEATESLGDKLKKFGHQVEVAAEPLGTAFLDALEELLPVFEGVIKGAAAVIGVVADFPKPLLIAATAITAIGTAAAGVILLLPKLQQAVNTLKMSISGIGQLTGLGGWATGIGAVLGPLGLLVTGLVAVGTISKQVTDATARQREALVANTNSYYEYCDALGQAGAYELEGMIRQEAANQKLKLSNEQMVEATNVAGYMARSVEGLTGAQYYESLALGVQIATGQKSLATMEDQIDAYNDANKASKKAADVAEAYGISQDKVTDSMVDSYEASEHLTAALDAYSTVISDATDPTKAWNEALEASAKAAGKTSAEFDAAKTSIDEYLASLKKEYQDAVNLQANLAKEAEVIGRLYAGDPERQAEAIQLLNEQAAKNGPGYVAMLLGADDKTVKQVYDTLMGLVDQNSDAHKEEQADRQAALAKEAGQKAGEEGALAQTTAHIDTWDRAINGYNFGEVLDKAATDDIALAGASGGAAWAGAFIEAVTAGLKVLTTTLSVQSIAASAAAGTNAAGDIDQDWLMQMMGLGSVGELTGFGGMAPSTEGVWRRLKSMFPEAAWMGGFATSGHVPGSDHYTGHAFDVGGTAWTMETMKNWLVANMGALGVKYVIYNHMYYDANGAVPYTGSNPHTDHVHVSTYALGGIANEPTVALFGEAGVPEAFIPIDNSKRSQDLWMETGVRLGMLQAYADGGFTDSYRTALNSDMQSLIKSIRDLVNADAEVAKGLKGITANQQILDAFSSRSSLADSYVSRESARLSMQQATGADLATQTATLKREIEFIDKAIAEAQLQLATAKSRGMDQAEINRLSQNLSGLQQSAAEARDDLEALARTPLEQAADRWSNAISQTNMMMDLLSNSSSALALQSSLFPDLMGQLGGGYQNALDLMNASTSPSDIVNYGDQALSGLDSMFSAEKSQLDRALDDTLNSIDSAQDSWENAWDARYEALQDSVDAQREKLDEQLSNLDKAQQEELDKLTKFYDDRLKLMQDAETAITREQQRNSSQKTLGGLEDELRILQGQGFYTEADIARMRELETQIQEQRDSMAQQEAAWKREDERAALKAEKAAALEKLQAQQEAERVALQDQIDAAQKSLQAQLDAMKRERKLQEQQFEQQREAAQQAYQQQLDLSVQKYAELMQQVIDAENNLLGETGQYQNAGYALGQSFAQGIIDSIPEIQAAAQLAAQTAADYLELHSPAKLGPLSTLDEWWDAFVPTLTKDFDIADLIQPVVDTYGPSTPVAATATQAVQTIVHTGEEVIRVVLESVVPNDSATLDALADKVSRKIGKRVEVASWGRD